MVPSQSRFCPKGVIGRAATPIFRPRFSARAAGAMRLSCTNKSEHASDKTKDLSIVPPRSSAQFGFGRSCCPTKSAHIIAFVTRALKVSVNDADRPRNITNVWRLPGLIVPFDTMDGAVEIGLTIWLEKTIISASIRLLRLYSGFLAS